MNKMLIAACAALAVFGLTACDNNSTVETTTVVVGKEEVPTLGQIYQEAWETEQSVNLAEVKHEAESYGKIDPKETSELRSALLGYIQARELEEVDVEADITRVTRLVAPGLAPEVLLQLWDAGADKTVLRPVLKKHYDRLLAADTKKGFVFGQRYRFFDTKKIVYWCEDLSSQLLHDIMWRLEPESETFKKWRLLMADLATQGSICDESGYILGSPSSTYSTYMALDYPKDAEWVAEQMLKYRGVKFSDDFETDQSPMFLALDNPWLTRLPKEKQVPFLREAAEEGVDNRDYAYAALMYEAAGDKENAARMKLFVKNAPKKS